MRQVDRALHLSSGTVPVTVNRTSTPMTRCGFSGARSATSATASPRRSWRPFVRMCTTSMPMQPASAKPSAWTGDGPADPALSSVIVAAAGTAAEDQIVLPDELDLGRRFHGAIVAGRLHRPAEWRRLAAARVSATIDGGSLRRLGSAPDRLPKRLETASHASGSATSM